MKVDVVYDVRPLAQTKRMRRVHAMFGLSEVRRRVVVLDGFEIDLKPGQVVLVTGPSGGGKSSLLRALAGQLDNTLDLASVCFGAGAIVDEIGGDSENALWALSRAGLAEAFLSLRSFDQLSDGQRYRACLAKALASDAAWIMADDFCASLDRTLAKVVAYNVRRVVDRTGVGFVLAAAHTDFVEDLQPDVHVEKGFGSDVRAVR